MTRALRAIPDVTVRNDGRPVFYFDVASPYAYLASTRLDAVMGVDVVWRPILVGALHRHYRRVSWGATPALRASGVAEIEARARDRGLPPILWPNPYPANALTAMRAAVWAETHGRARPFAEAAFALAFVDGVDLTERAAVLAASERAGLDPDELDRALDTAALKQRLREANDAAVATGVYRVPTVDAGGLLWWGDHLLEAAAAAQIRCTPLN